MKSKENKSNHAKLSKTAKVALPFFALFGGNGFASSRNPLSLQSSRKTAGKSVVYINEVDSPELPSLVTNNVQQIKSPFAAFTNQSVTKIKTAELVIQSEAMSFLTKNNLLSSNKTITSNLSGNTHNRKTFSDDWQWSTRLANTAPFASDSANTSVCQTGATYSGSAIGYMIGRYSTYFGSYTCLAVNPAGTSVVAGFIYDPSASAILPACQARHQACDGQPLPVELMNFEIE